MNKNIGVVFYLGWLFVWVTLLYPEMVSRIAALGLTGTQGLFVNALSFAFLLFCLITPIYMMFGRD